MSQTRIARRYAEALMMAAVEVKREDKVGADMRMIESAIVASHELRLFLKSPVIKREKKRTIIVEIFGGSIDTLTKDFLVLIAEKGREDALAEIITQYFRLDDERNGIVEVRVRSAIDLTKEQSENLKKRFETVTAKHVRLVPAKDTTLIGGVVARVGDTVYDGSVKRQLELLRDRFVHAPQNT
jgi:F-type H+-transporting ATPase subunit delta